MPIDYKEFIVHRLHEANISKLSNVNANDIVKIDKSAVENYRKELMDKLYSEGYVVITHLEEAIDIVQKRISRLVPPHMESIGYKVDEKGCKVPNPSIMVDPDADKRYELLEKLEILFSKLSDAQAADKRLDFDNLVKYELDNINYSLDKVNDEISNFVYEINRKIENANSEKNKYVEHAIMVMEEFEMTRGQYKYRTTNQFSQVPLVRHKCPSNNTSTKSSVYRENDRKSTQKDTKGNVYKEYYQDEIYIIEVMTFVNLDELIKKLKREKAQNPVLYIKNSEISKLTTVEEMEKQMNKINYVIKKDKMGFYSKTIYGHIIFFEEKKYGA